MGIGQRVGHLAGERRGRLHRKASLTLEPLPQRLALDVGHDEVRHRSAGAIVEHAGIEDRKDVRVLEPGGELDLAEKALHALAATELGANHLQATKRLWRRSRAR